MPSIDQRIEIDRPPFLGGGKWKLRDLTSISVIFGRNGSGKSQLLRNVRELNGRKKYSHYSSPERAGRFDYQPGNVNQEMNGERRASSRTSNYQENYRNQVITRIGAYLQKRGRLHRENIPGNPKELESFLNDLIPTFRIEIPEDGDVDIPVKLKRLNDQGVFVDVGFDVGQMSSGESEILSLGLDLLTVCAMWKLDNYEKRLLLIDEPDTHLHPELQQHLARFLVRLSDEYGCQLLVATHSTTFLAALGYHGQNTSVVFLNNNDEELRAIPFNTYLKELATCLGGHALMGPLFAVPLLLVDGDDDYCVWSEAVRGPWKTALKMAVIPCNGSEIDHFKQTLNRMLSSLVETSGSSNGNPLGIVLKDRDDSNAQSSRTFGLVQEFRLQCREIENLYISDEVLEHCKTDWESVKVKINQKAEAGDFGEKAQRMKDLITSDRLTIDLKNLMHELEEVVDPHKLSWRLRIGQCLRKEPPRGLLRQFLGEEFVSCVWPASVT